MSRLVYKGGLAVGQEAFFYSLFRELESSLVWEFELFQEFCLFQESWEFCEICEICDFWVPQLLLRD